MLEIVDRRQKNWFWLYSHIFDLQLSIYAIGVYAYLCKIAEGGVAEVSLKTLSKTLRVKKIFVEKGIKELEEKGLIRKEVVKHGEQYLTTRYILIDHTAQEGVLKDTPPIGHPVL